MPAVDLLRELIAFPSVSRDSNAPISDHVAELLRRRRFEVERIEFVDALGVKKVSLVAKRGAGRGGLGYFAHTDVVPADDWFDAAHGPFDPVERDGRLYGRGSCDMKGSLACALAAVDVFGERDFSRPLYITCTADEEVGFGGAKSVVNESTLYREMVLGGTRGIIGEPTRLEVVYAHKGVAGAHVVSRGRAAHSSTREGLNANLAMIPFLAEMKVLYDETETDPRWRNDEFDPPTVSWNIGINDHTRAVNITPPQSVCTIYFRPMPGTDTPALVERVRNSAQRHGLEFHLAADGAAVYTPPDSPFVREMLELAERAQARTVAYGTDGTEFHELKQLVVYGPGDIAQAHTKDEWIALEQLEQGTRQYARLIERYCLG